MPHTGNPEAHDYAAAIREGVADMRAAFDADLAALAPEIRGLVTQVGPLNQDSDVRSMQERFRNLIRLESGVEYSGNGVIHYPV